MWTFQTQLYNWSNRYPKYAKLNLFIVLSSYIFHPKMKLKVTPLLLFGEIQHCCKFILIMFHVWSYRYLVPLRERDSEGRRVIFSVAAKFDPYKFSSSQMARIHSIVVESLMDDEENQVIGKRKRHLRYVHSLKNVVRPFLTIYLKMDTNLKVFILG